MDISWNLDTPTKFVMRRVLKTHTCQTVENILANLRSRCPSSLTECCYWWLCIDLKEETFLKLIFFFFFRAGRSPRRFPTIHWVCIFNSSCNKFWVDVWLKCPRDIYAHSTSQIPKKFRRCVKRKQKQNAKNFKGTVFKNCFNTVFLNQHTP